MAISTTINPSLVTPGLKAHVSFSSTLTACNHVRVLCTSAPRGSSLRKKLDTSGTSAGVQVYSGSVTNQWEFVPDLGGAYAFSLVEMQRGASQYGGGYFGDSASNDTETTLGSGALTIYCGSALEAKLGVGSDTATLKCTTFGSTIQATSVAVHGDQSPVISNPTSSKSKTASESAAVVAAATALAGVSASTAIGSPNSVASSLLAWYTTHRASTTYHAAADSVNVLATGGSNPSTAASLASALNDLRAKLDRHMRNDAAGAGTGTGSYHAPGAVPTIDASVSILAPPCSAEDRGSQMVLLADLMRVVVAHKVSAVHAASDVTAAPTTSPLLTLHSAFLEALASTSPTAPSNANPGATILIHSGGFKES